MAKIGKVKEKIKKNPQSKEEIILHYARSSAPDLTEELLEGRDGELAREAWNRLSRLYFLKPLVTTLSTIFRLSKGQIKKGPKRL
jgi:hypothetical protein